jgi:hypothetical protein
MSNHKGDLVKLTWQARRGGGTSLIDLNSSLLSWAILCKILEMAEVEIPNNRTASAKDIPNSFTNRSAISERTRETLPRWLP